MFSRKISIAPMLDWTDRHERYFLRLISQHCVLFTEMITTGALLHGPRQKLIEFDQAEHPIVAQLGGSDAKELAECSKILEQAGYDEVNLNLGCPSDRVQSGRFGACLMADASLVAQSIKAMCQSVNIPVSAKTRIGIDNADSYEYFRDFVRVLADSGVNVFYIHARKAWLQGLSPKQNREIPPLHYDYVYRIKEEFPHLNISLNGGVKSLQQADAHLRQVDGVMIGRAAYENPYLLAPIDQKIYASSCPLKTRKQILNEYLPYIEKQLSQGVKLTAMSRHLLGLFHGLPGARGWRQHISENAHKAGMGVELIWKAAERVDEAD
ncbi:MAG: tRNA dihydrouridine(20/20a) synthase DusA [Gammaproteobacteria bacterium]|nr:tRNA dihydrouridine(20/20a) synthase DusA [Gammaproteobacteria bacterium]